MVWPGEGGRWRAKDAVGLWGVGGRWRAKEAVGLWGVADHQRAKEAVGQPGVGGVAPTGTVISGREGVGGVASLKVTVFSCRERVRMGCGGMLSKGALQGKARG